MPRGFDGTHQFLDNGQPNMEGYPPAPVLWGTAFLDSVCHLDPSGQCCQWRDWMGIDGSSSWLSHTVPRIYDHTPEFITYRDFVASQTTMTTTTTTMDIDASSSWLASWTSNPTIHNLYQFAFETPATALGDLTSPTGALVLVFLLLVFRAVKSVLLPMFSAWGRSIGRSTHGVAWEAANEERVAKFGEYVYRLLYHSLISLYGIWYFCDKEWWANGADFNATASLYQGFPDHQPVQPGMAWYYLLQCAYNVDAMISLVELSLEISFQWPVALNPSADNAEKKIQAQSLLGKLVGWMSPVSIRWSKHVRGDFQEMMIHHVATNLLVVGSSSLGLTRVGSMVFLVHDVSDVPVDLSKLANFMKWKWTTVVCFLTMVTVWVLTRLYILPYRIYRSILFQSHFVVEGVPVILWITYRHFFYVLLGLLIFLHHVWFYMFLKIFAVLLFKNECHDLSEHKQGEEQSSKSNGNAKGKRP